MLASTHAAEQRRIYADAKAGCIWSSQLNPMPVIPRPWAVWLLPLVMVWSAVAFCHLTNISSWLSWPRCSTFSVHLSAQIHVSCPVDWLGVISSLGTLRTPTEGVGAIAVALTTPSPCQPAPARDAASCWVSAQPKENLKSSPVQPHASFCCWPDQLQSSCSQWLAFSLGHSACWTPAIALARPRPPQPVLLQLWAPGVTLLLLVAAYKVLSTWRQVERFGVVQPGWTNDFANIL